MRISDWSSDVCSSDLLRGLWRMSSKSQMRNDEYDERIYRGEGKEVDARRRQRIPRQSNRGSGGMPHPRWRRSHAPAWAAARSEEHTSELKSLMRISYAVFCLQTKTTDHIVIT